MRSPRVVEVVWPVGFTKSQVDWLVRIVGEYAPGGCDENLKKEVLHLLKTRQAVRPIGRSVFNAGVLVR